MLRLDFTKFTSTCSPLSLYPALSEEPSWLMPDALPDEVSPDQLRRYVLLMFSRKSPLHSETDLEKRKDKALQGAGVTRKLWETKGWQLVRNFALAPSLHEMVQALMMREQDRLYERWLSYLIAHSMMLRELREGVDALLTEADKKTLAFERKLKISNGMDRLSDKIDEMEKRLFEGDEAVASTITAMGQKASVRKGGWAEQYSS